MLLDIRELKNKKEQAINVEFNEKLTSKALSSLQVEFVLPPTVRVTAFRDGNLIHVAGEIEAELRLPCARCLEPYQKNFKTDFQISYSLGGQELDEDVERLTGSKIELDAVVIDTILLELPMKTLCREDCKGLCSICGQDLNQKECDCDREILDPRLADLKKLLQE